MEFKTQAKMLVSFGKPNEFSGMYEQYEEIDVEKEYRIWYKLLGE